MVAEIRERLLAPANDSGNGRSPSLVPPSLESERIPFRPFQIVSLLDLRKYFLVPLQNLALIIEGLYWNVLEGVDLPALEKDRAVITPDHAEKFKAVLLDHGKHVRYLELKQSLKYVRLMLKKFSDGGYKYQEYKRDVETLQGREDDELEDVVFGFIPADQAPYFDQKQLFGAEVTARFPESEWEITEAGNCYAHGTYTACVFHLMRALEIALHVLAAELGVKFPASIELENWQNIIEKIESAIRKLENQPKGKQKSEDLKYYSEAAKEFRYFKDAWRNHVSHSRADYDVHEATRIMEHTRDFMKHLAFKKLEFRDLPDT